MYFQKSFRTPKNPARIYPTEPNGSKTRQQKQTSADITASKFIPSRWKRNASVCNGLVRKSECYLADRTLSISTPRWPHEPSTSWKRKHRTVYWENPHDTLAPTLLTIASRWIHSTMLPAMARSQSWYRAQSLSPPVQQTTKHSSHGWQ